jgi:hypothetical protein
MATPIPPEAPTAAPIQRIQTAYAARAETDYLFSFWTAFGWTLLSCGIYGLYVLYHLVKRSVDHNKRRLELLDAATALAWERATAERRADELRPHFERIGAEMGVLRAMTTDFRDPMIWTILAVVASGIVQIILYVLLDQDLVKHDRSERAIEAELAAVYGALGADVPAPAGAPKQPHSYGGRVIATIVSFGIYGLFWLYNIMEEGNLHYQENWAWEDGLRAGLGGA